VEETLTTGAAQQEHCGLAPATVAASGGRLGRQVLIRRRGGARACWHVTSAELSECSFPKLGALLAAKADHAVAFHGWTAERIGVGGGVVDRAANPERHRRHEALKEEVRAAIQAALDELGPPWNALPVVLETSGAFSGRHPDNVANRITGFGNGVQVEQPEAVRKGARVRDAVAQAVADVYLRQGDV
jgi:phage replication-related protein YjqB (UPF0714/DUF867 family)